MRACLMLTVLSLLALPAEGAHERLWSKVYEFKAGVTLAVGAETGDGLRLDSVRFDVPSNAGTRTAREATVEVMIANGSDFAQRIGVAVALFDESGRLVGVADGGTALIPLRSGHIKPYRMTFQNLNAAAPSATTFQISVEAKP